MNLLLDTFMSPRTKLVLSSLGSLQGLTQYEAVKRISYEKNIATSTVKYILKKLMEAGLVIYNGSVELTESGLLISQMLRGDSIIRTKVPISPELRSSVTQYCSRLQTCKSGSEARSPHLETFNKNKQIGETNERN